MCQVDYGSQEGLKWALSENTFLKHVCPHSNPTRLNINACLSLCLLFVEDEETTVWWC